MSKIHSAGEQLIVNVSGEKELSKNLSIFNAFVKVPYYKTFDMREKIAAHMLSRERYCLE